MIKTILTFGCSFTANPPCWPYRLREITKENITHYNFGKDSVGNGFISKKAMYVSNQLKERKLKKEETLFLVMWSSPFRSEFFMDSKLVGEKKYRSFGYTGDEDLRWNKLTNRNQWQNPISLSGVSGKSGWLLNGNLFHGSTGGHDNSKISELYLRFQELDLFNAKHQYLTNIEHIVKLGNFFENKNINFKFMFGFPVKRFLNEISNGDTQFELEGNFLLNEINKDWFIECGEFENVYDWGNHYDSNGHQWKFDDTIIKKLNIESNGLYELDKLICPKDMQQNHHPTIFGHQVFVNEYLKKIKWDIFNV